MALRPHHVGIVVSDLERSRRFYEALGFATVQEHGDPDRSITFMALGDLQVELFWYRETPPAAGSGPGRTLGFRHLALATDDLDAEIARLRGAGVVPDDAEVREVPGGFRLLFFDDPDGMEIEVMHAGS